MPRFAAARPTPTQRRRPRYNRTLDMLLISHNFIRPHFTTRTVPAVALGMVEKGSREKKFA